MVIDYGIDDKHCQKALHSKALVFVTTQNRVKIEFVCDQIRKFSLTVKMLSQSIFLNHCYVYKEEIISALPLPSPNRLNASFQFQERTHPQKLKWHYSISAAAESP